MAQSLFAGDGPAARTQAAYDWSVHPMGVPEGWPSTLKVAIRFIMAAPEPMYITWGADQHLFFNDAYVPAMGPRAEHAVGSRLPVIWSDVYEQVRPMVEDAFAGRSNQFHDIPLQMARRGVTEDTWWSFFFTPIFDEFGAVVGMFCLTNETTERTLSERKMLLLEREYRAINANIEQQVVERSSERGRIWQLSADLLAVSSTGDYFEATNPAWQRILGWEAAELAALSYPNFVHPEDSAKMHRAFVQARQGTALVRLESRLKRRDGDYRWFSWSIVSEHGQLYCSGRDVTEEKAQSRALEKAQEQLRQAQKMEAVGQLTGGIAHDFNNLLGGILVSTEVIQLRLKKAQFDSIPALLDNAMAATKRAAALTHRLLAFSRRQTLDPKPIDMNRLVGGMEDLIARTIGPAIRMQVDGSRGLWPVFADPTQVDSALLNLCINARDAMPDGGCITITTGNRQIDAATAEAWELEPGHYVSLCVGDTGTGMPPEVIAQAFDPFFTTKPLGQGTGLGLSMIYGFTRQSGGAVRIHSELGRGSTVCLYLPRHIGAPEIAAEPVVLDNADGHGETILFVDDEPSIRGLAVEALSAQGFRVLEAADGPAAMRVLNGGAPIDLLVTDVGLPGGMNGRQVADAARATRPQLPVLFITGYAEGAVLGDRHLEPGMDVLTKPFTLAALTQRIHAGLAR